MRTKEPRRVACDEHGDSFNLPGKGCFKCLAQAAGKKNPVTNYADFKARRQEREHKILNDLCTGIFGERPED